MNRDLRLTTTLALSAAYVVGRLVLQALPGISFSYLVLFIAGVAFGPRVGISVGVLGRFTSDLVLTGLNPVFVPMLFVDVVLGATAGLVGHVMDLGQRGAKGSWWTRSVLITCGLYFTAAYSVLADTATWIFYNFILPDAPDAARQALWGTLVLAGLVFNIPAILFNMVLFPAVVPAILSNLYAAGLLPERRRVDLPLPKPVS